MKRTFENSSCSNSSSNTNNNILSYRDEFSCTKFEQIQKFKKTINDTIDIMSTMHSNFYQFKVNLFNLIAYSSIITIIKWIDSDIDVEYNYFDNFNINNGNIYNVNIDNIKCDTVLNKSNENRKLEKIKQYLPNYQELFHVAIKNEITYSELKKSNNQSNNQFNNQQYVKNITMYICFLIKHNLSIAYNLFCEQYCFYFSPENNKFVLDNTINIDKILFFSIKYSSGGLLFITKIRINEAACLKYYDLITFFACIYSSLTCLKLLPTTEYKFNKNMFYWLLLGNDNDGNFLKVVYHHYSFYLPPDIIDKLFDNNKLHCLKHFNGHPINMSNITHDNIKKLFEYVNNDSNEKGDLIGDFSNFGYKFTENDCVLAASTYPKIFKILIELGIKITMKICINSLFSYGSSNLEQIYNTNYQFDNSLLIAAIYALNVDCVKFLVDKGFTTDKKICIKHIDFILNKHKQFIKQFRVYQCHDIVMFHECTTYARQHNLLVNECHLCVDKHQCENLFDPFSFI